MVLEITSAEYIKGYRLIRAKLRFDFQELNF